MGEIVIYDHIGATALSLNLVRSLFVVVVMFAMFADLRTKSLVNSIIIAILLPILQYVAF